jgi:hypothetical protein
MRVDSVKQCFRRTWKDYKKRAMLGEPSQSEYLVKSRAWPTISGARSNMPMQECQANAGAERSRMIMDYHGGYTMTLIWQQNRSWSFYGAFDYLWSWPFVKPSNSDPFMWAHWGEFLTQSDPIPVIVLWPWGCALNARTPERRTREHWEHDTQITQWLTWHDMDWNMDWKWSILIDFDCNGSHMEP